MGNARMNAVGMATVERKATKGHNIYEGKQALKIKQGKSVKKAMMSIRERVSVRRGGKRETHQWRTSRIHSSASASVWRS